MTTLPTPTARYMSTLDDSADQIMYAAATLVARDIATQGIDHPAVSKLGMIDPWDLHTAAIQKFKEIVPVQMPDACIGDTEVRYTVFEVVTDFLVSRDLADHSMSAS